MKLVPLVVLGMLLSASIAPAQWRSPLLLDPSPIAIEKRGIDLPLSSLLLVYDGLVLTDISLTQRGLEGGMIEGNPIMAGVANNRAAFFAVKIAGALLVNVAIKAVWNLSHVGGYALAVLLVLAQGFVDIHNYQLTR